MADPIDPAILAGAMAGGGKKVSSRAADLNAGLDVMQEGIRATLADAFVTIGQKVAESESARDAAFQASVLDKVKAAEKANVRIRKAAAVANNAVNDKVQDHINNARKELRSVGAELPMLPDEIYGYNHLGEHDRLALEQIILPALRQTAAEEQAAINGESDTRLPPSVVLPPIDGGTSPPPAAPPPPPTSPLGGPPPNIDPTPPTDPTCPAGYVWGTEPQTGRVGWVCPGADLAWIPGVPISPPPPASPPPSPPPPPPSEDCECPEPQLVIRMPGCPDVVIQGVPVDGSGPLPPPPNTSGEPRPTVPPPNPPSKPGSNTPIPIPPVPPVPAASGVGGSWDGPNYCANVAAVAGTQTTVIAPDVLSFLGKLPGAIASLVPFLPKEAVVAIDSLGQNAVKWVEYGIETAAYGEGIANPRVVGGTLAGMIVPAAIGHYTGVDMGYTLEPRLQAMRYSSPVYMPDQGAIDAAYLRGVIDFDTWTCYTRTEGNLPYVHSLMMQAGRSLPNMNDAIQMHLRGNISDDQFWTYARQNGFLEREHVDRLYKLTEYIPSTPELFTWIKKDVYDDKFAAFVGLDEDFPDPLPPEWQRWFKANGTSAQQILYEYRAQWNLPSTTMLGEMQARLRPGRVPAELVTTPADVDRLLKLDEWPKGLRGRIEYILTQPINRTDIGAAYVAGTISEQEVYERLLDLKYTPDSAALLRDLLIVKSEGQQQSSIGAWTRRTIVQSYVGGSLNRAASADLLSRTIRDPARVNDALDDADTLRAARAREKCIAGIRKRYLTGEFTTDEAKRRLRNYEMDMEQSNVIAEGWACERAGRVKEPTVKMLKDWVTNGIISWDEFGRRLINLGYTEDDTTRIRQATDLAERQRIKKAVDAAREKADAAARRKARSDAAARRQRPTNN